jgi:hypothetical protein
MRAIASAIVVLAGAIVAGAGIVGRALASKSGDTADGGLLFGVLLGLTRLIAFGISFQKEAKD